MNNKDIINAALQEIITPSHDFSIERIAYYFNANYRQTVNGEVLLYADFVKHVRLLHQVLKSVEIKIIAMVEEGDIVFSHHHVLALKHNGSKMHTQVMAQFTLQDAKIIQCDELTHLISGHDDDHDLGSRVN